jgi:hypothetical protein
MRQKIETAYELVNGGEPVVPWLWSRLRAGAPVARIAGELSVICGFEVSPAEVRRMMTDG